MLRTSLLEINVPSDLEVLKSVVLTKLEHLRKENLSGAHVILLNDTWQDLEDYQYKKQYEEEIRSLLGEVGGIKELERLQHQSLQQAESRSAQELTDAQDIYGDTAELLSSRQEMHKRAVHNLRAAEEKLKETFQLWQNLPIPSHEMPEPVTSHPPKEPIQPVTQQQVITPRKDPGLSLAGQLSVLEQIESIRNLTIQRQEKYGNWGRRSDKTFKKYQHTNAILRALKAVDENPNEETLLELQQRIEHFKAQAGTAGNCILSFFKTSEAGRTKHEEEYFQMVESAMMALGKTLDSAVTHTKPVNDSSKTDTPTQSVRKNISKK